MKFVGYVYRVYCLTTSKSYIGITTQDIDRRWSQHKNESTGDEGLRLNHFHMAIRKYGWDQFEKTILLKLESDTLENLVESLNQLETFYIEKYDSYNNGYNSTLGGGGIISDSVYKKVLVFNENGDFIKECESRKAAAEEFNVMQQNVSDCCSRKILSSGWKDGLRLIFRNEDDIITEEDLIKIKKARKNQPVPVRCYDFYTGEILGEYESIVQASEETGVSKDGISSCSLLKTKSTVKGGKKLVWRKLQDTYEPKYIIEAFINGKSVGKFTSVSHAAKTFDINPGHISDYLKGRKHGDRYNGELVHFVSLK